MRVQRESVEAVKRKLELERLRLERLRLERLRLERLRLEREKEQALEQIRQFNLRRNQRFKECYKREQTFWDEGGTIPGTYKSIQISDLNLNKYRSIY